MFINLLRSIGLRNAVLAAAAASWLGAIGVGGLAMLNHAYSAGVAGTVDQHWPAGDKLSWTRSRPALVMVLHPNCPCSAASVEQLDRLLSAFPGAVEAFAVFRPSTTSNPGAVRRHAERIPGLRVFEDVDGEIAPRLGAGTSGEAFFFGTDGALIFHGGLTPSRGHAGAGIGHDALLALISGRKSNVSSAPIFGCSVKSGDER